ncbi:hypothetical protein [Clostridium felsineum]|uniref:hypothetical protein n=1 Tax=Clostridium felsineum TaxID=36839 RepID=UPI0009D5499B|nr:hypothetical protein [Clostridium felsineum]URZ18571.1 hypothetical protein CLFE_046590 [Clostridium felsineum DSM 794]
MIIIAEILYGVPPTLSEMLAVPLFVQSTTAVDDLVKMFIKKMMNINRKAKQELEKSQLESIKKSD